MDKLKIEEVYILCTKSIADGRIAEFFKSRGTIGGYCGRAIGSYYYSEGGIMGFSEERPKNRTRINPWKKSRRKFPREMMVSLDKKSWQKRIVIGKLKTFYPYIAIKKPYELDDKFQIELISWKYAKEID